MPQSILFYPSIDICDGSWLRSAALYWDEICSIVPDENCDMLSPELLYLKERNQYNPIYPADIFRLNNLDDFSDTVKKYFSKDKIRRYRNCNQNIKPVDLLYDPSLAAMIHYKKIPDQITDMLLSSGCIQRTGIDDEWFNATPEFIFRYMQLLSEFVVKHDNRDIVASTDKESKLNSLYPRTLARRTCQGISITIDKCLPVPAPDISFEDILNFKEKRRNELAEFRQVLRKFERTIGSCMDECQLKSEIEGFRDQLAKQLIDTQQMMHEERINFVVGSLRTMIADAAGMAGLLQCANNSGRLYIPQTAIATFVGAAGLIGVGACYRNYKNKIKEERNSNGFAYILSAKREGLLHLNPDTEII